MNSMLQRCCALAAPGQTRSELHPVQIFAGNGFLGVLISKANQHQPAISANQDPPAATGNIHCKVGRP